MSRALQQFCCQKSFPVPHMNMQKQFSKIFLFLQRYLQTFAKIMCPGSCWHWKRNTKDKSKKKCNLIHCLIHTVRTLTLCPCSRWLHWHGVGVVNNHVDTCWNSCWLCGHGVCDVGVVVDYKNHEQKISNFEIVKKQIFLDTNNGKKSWRRKKYAVKMT